MVGKAPPLEQVQIRFERLDGLGRPGDTVMPSDDNGVYDYELAASSWDLLIPGLLADVFYTEPSGHRSLARGVIELLILDVGTSLLQGVAEPGVRLEAEVWRATAGFENPRPEPGDPGASPLAWGETAAGSDGRFELPLWTTDEAGGEGASPRPAGRPFFPRALSAQALGPRDPGEMRVRLAHGRGRIELPLLPLGAEFLAGGRGVAGRTAPFTRVELHLHHQHSGLQLAGGQFQAGSGWVGHAAPGSSGSGGGLRERSVQTIWSDWAGRFIAPLPEDLDAQAVQMVEVRALPIPDAAIRLWLEPRVVERRFVPQIQIER